MGKFCCCFFTELSACDKSVFLFPDDNLSNCQLIFTKLGMCIDIAEICVGIANDQIFVKFLQLSARNTSLISLRDNNLSKYEWIFTKLNVH